MIEAIRVRNYKSVVDMRLRFGQLNVFIGENGSGKSNILEAIAMAAAAEKDNLTKGYLVSRGVRIIDDTELMTSNFHDIKADQSTKIDVYPIDEVGTLPPKNLPYREYTIRSNLVDGSFIRFDVEKVTLLKVENEIHELGNSVVDHYISDQRNTQKQIEALEEKIKSLSISFESLVEAINPTLENKKFKDHKITKSLSDAKGVDDFIKRLSSFVDKNDIEQADKFDETTDAILDGLNNDIKPLTDFLVFTPENTALRNFYKEGQVEPLGIHGEGLLRTLRSLRLKKGAMKDIEEALSLFGWYDSFTIPENLSDVEDKIYIKDKFIRSKFDQRSANEGFLFILFYMALIVSENTPKIFAIDNVDTSLNPKLCRKLIEVMSKLAVKYDKQMFLTTHNPAILDGIDLKDSKNKLFVVSRDYDGQTISKPISKDKVFNEADGKRLKFSEAFLRGYIGGLPKGF
ncbi:AAA family ATPase [Vibrio sp. Vb339]|uniref:AAA family ATPase n=1 Tax=Vibrio sp. Vb339 TaxID=1192013 RepID=UPI001556F48D|nr:AAA family ATPase [Vibrio sp. Vb339]